MTSLNNFWTNHFDDRFFQTQKFLKTFHPCQGQNCRLLVDCRLCSIVFEVFVRTFSGIYQGQLWKTLMFDAYSNACLPYFILFCAALNFECRLSKYEKLPFSDRSFAKLRFSKKLFNLLAAKFNSLPKHDVFFQSNFDNTLPHKSLLKCKEAFLNLC